MMHDALPPAREPNKLRRAVRGDANDFKRLRCGMEQEWESGRGGEGEIGLCRA